MAFGRLAGMVFAASAACSLARAGTSNPPPHGRGAGANFSSAAYADGIKAAPKLIAAAGLKCDVTQALDEGDASLFDAAGKRVGSAPLFEVACADDLGYLLTNDPKKPINALDCVTAATTGRIACMLPENSHPPAGLTKYLKTAGRPCQPQRARLVAQDLSLRIRRYEVACTMGDGVILDIPLADGSGPAPVALDCLAVDDQCRFTSHRDSVALLAHRLGRPVAKVCDVSDARYVGLVPAHDTDLYEVSCRTGQAGQLVEVTRSGDLSSIKACSDVKLKGAACALKPADEVDPLIAMAQADGTPTDPSDSPIGITHPAWLARPDGNAINDALSAKAKTFGVSGQVTLVCRVTELGSMRDCYAMDESPAGFGFAETALRLTPLFKMRPAAINGRPVDGASVHIPIKFDLSRVH